MNIKTERKEDDLWGTIEMSFNNMWFLDSAPSEWKEIWNNLMKEAQRVYIDGRGKKVIIELFDFISIILNGIYAPCMVFSCIGG